MNTISTPVAPTTLEELSAVAHRAHAELHALEQARADLDAGVPTGPDERADYYERRARLPELDAKLYRARAHAEQADANLKDARLAHQRHVRDEHTPERRQLVRRFVKALDAAAQASADLQALDDFVSLECDGHGFQPGQTLAGTFTGPDCTVERLKRELRHEGWL